MAYRHGINTKDTAMSFFKLPKPVWKLTDDEYVNRVRTVLRWSKPWSKAGTILWLAIVVAMFVISLKMVGVAIDYPSGPETSSITLAYLLGGMAGGMMGFTLLKAVVLVGEVWAMERTYRILVETWDRMKELERLNAGNGSDQIKPPPAGAPPP